MPGRLGCFVAALCFLVMGTQMPVAEGFWTVDCGILTKERSDPLAFPGIESAHTHVVAGSSNFGRWSTNDVLRQGMYILGILSGQRTHL